MPFPLPLLIGAALQAEPAIVVTGAREAVEEERAPVSATVLDEATLEAIGLPDAAGLLRLAPGVAVAATGPRGTQTQLRIRGAEANHSLLFVDGIRFNDPAAGNEARFELLGADLLSRLEVVRGPQSALWGSEALGGVVAAETADPLAPSALRALAEYGSLDSARLAGRYGVADGGFGVAGGAAWQRSDGIDSFGGGGDRDGFESFAATVKAALRTGPVVLGAVGHWIEGVSQYDGFDPLSGRRADTLDETRNRIGAGRTWIAAETGGWTLRADASYLDSANRNRLADAPLNATSGNRLALGIQASRQVGRHRLIAAAEHQSEEFRARDTVFGGATRQDRTRRHNAVVGEWQAEWNEAVATDLAVRHDDFSAFADSTTLRAALLVRPAAGWTLHAAYGEGIAQPTFYDLYGFFPGSFAGNPALRPERSRGWEAGFRWRGTLGGVGATFFQARLRDEIFDVFDPATGRSSTANGDGTSRRRGLELEAEYRHSDALNLAASYTWLDAEEPSASGLLVREVRRPRHSASLIAHGSSGRFRWGASLAYVGARRDTDFDTFPALPVRLGDYLLASLNLGWRIAERLELFGRVENGFDADYQDVFGYNTAGRRVHAGLRVDLGR